MKIKRYTAPSMRIALDQVRIEQGVDAVILSSRRIPEGIEVIAAVDYDETLMVAARPQRSTPTPMSTPNPNPNPNPSASPAPAPASALARKQAAEALPPATATLARSGPAAAPSARHAAGESRPVAASVRDPAVAAIGREVQGLRQLLETELAGLKSHNRRLRAPQEARVHDALAALDIAPDIAAKLSALTPRAPRLRNAAHLPAALLAAHLPVVADRTLIEGGIVAVVGPTGVGKTTTIAKLAARWSLQHGSADLALISTDDYRIGAREQLSTYARILGAPMYAANSGKELADVLARLEAKKLILIDTAGMGPRDIRLRGQLAALRAGAAQARVLLALPAQGERHALEDIATSFARLAPVACILTKVDEAASLGAAISTAMRHRLPIAYLCNGQRVPEDLHGAFTRRVWLVRAAMRLRDREARSGMKTKAATRQTEEHTHA
jgi:flagellar biosynthesis protein FlhF